MSTALVKIFEALRSKSAPDDHSYAVVAIPGLNNHRIGITKEGLPIFFVHCGSGPAKVQQSGYRLDRIAIQFDKQCRIRDGDQNESLARFTTIELRPGTDGLTGYFLDVFFLLIKSLPNGATVGDLNERLMAVLSLFNHLSNLPKRTIQGLWSELLVIEQAKDPHLLLRAWHREPIDKYDFNDGISKVEVKSASTQRRIHHFSAEQLLPNPSSQTLIVSITAIETSVGSNIDDLIERIDHRLQDDKLLLELKMKVGSILASSLETARDHYFDYVQAADSIALYDTADIPKIKAEHIPSQIQHVTYDCDLTGVSPTWIGKDGPALLSAI